MHLLYISHILDLLKVLCLKTYNRDKRNSRIISVLGRERRERCECVSTAQGFLEVCNFSWAMVYETCGLGIVLDSQVIFSHHPWLIAPVQMHQGSGLWWRRCAALWVGGISLQTCISCLRVERIIHVETFPLRHPLRQQSSSVSVHAGGISPSSVQGLGQDVKPRLWLTPNETKPYSL